METELEKLTVNIINQTSLKIRFTIEYQIFVLS
jgi:hypothetical protein